MFKMYLNEMPFLSHLWVDPHATSPASLHDLYACNYTIKPTSAAFFSHCDANHLFRLANFT